MRNIDKVQEVKLKCGIKVLADFRTKKKCKCGQDIWFARTQKGKTMPIVLVGLAEWDTHFADCPFAKKFRKRERTPYATK